MANTIHQHTTPKCYLKNFSDSGHNLHTRRKIPNQSMDEVMRDIKNPISLKSATVIDNFYTVKSGNDPMVVETQVYAREIENRYPPLYKLLVDPNRIEFSQMERIWMLSCLLSLHCRTPKQFKLFESTIPVEFHHEIDKIKEDYKAAHILEVLPSFIEAHQFKRIIVSKITDGSEFITSDNPVLIIGQDEKGTLLRNNDFKEQFNKANRIVIPLDTKHCVILTHALDKNGIDAEGVVFYNKIERRDIDCSFVQQVNWFMLNSAEKYYFGSEKYMKAFFSTFGLVD